MTRRSRRAENEAALTDEVLAKSQVVGQVLFTDEDDGVVTIDVVALSVRHPSGRSAPGSAFELRLRVPYDPMWGQRFCGILNRWAEDNKVVGMDFGTGEPPVVTLRSADCTLRLDLVTDSLF